MIGHVLADLFRWPDGIVVGNLIASALWAAPAFLHLNRKVNAQHEQRRQWFDDLHGKLREYHEQREAWRAQISRELRELRDKLDG